MKTVSITIPCRNEEKYIGKCLQSIVDSNFDKELLNVYVCDGNSDDTTQEIIKEFANKFRFINLVINSKRTTPYALNLGLKHHADVKIILGAHAEIDKDYIINCLKTFELDNNLGCVGGVIENVIEDASTEIISIAMSSSFGVGNAYFRTGTKDGYVDTVAFGAYKSEVFDKIGYFDEDLVRNQDDEYNYRLTKNGFKIYLSRSIHSKYYVRTSYVKLFKQYYQYGYWKVYVNKKHNAITSIRQLVPALFVLYIFIGLIATLLLPMLGYLYLAGLLTYLLAGFVSAIKAASGFVKSLKVLYVFIILHFSYGYGYLYGILNFIILGKKPSKKLEQLTR